MNIQEMESKYASLKTARDSGRITTAQFQSDVAQLRLPGPDGAWYQINPEDGKWLKWNGQAWEKGIPPSAQQPAPAKFFPLLGLILKNTFRTIRQQLPRMIVFGVIGWLLHTFLLVVINEGFGDSTFVGNFLATKGNSLSGTIIWMVVSGFLFSWIGKKTTKGGAKAARRPLIQLQFHEAGALALSALLAAAGLSLVIGTAVNSYGSLALAVGFGGLMLSKGGSVVSLLISSAWSSTYGMIQNQKSAAFSSAAAQVAMAGGIAGFVLSSFVSSFWLKACFGVAMLVGAFILTRRQGLSSAVLLALFPPLLLIGAIIYLLKNAMPVFADDGGWREAGGTFSGWAQSQGAVTAVAMGTGPAIGTVLGPALSQTLVEIAENIPTDNGGNAVTEAPPAPASQGTSSVIDEKGEPLATWEPGKYGPGANGKNGQPGDVWYGDRWVSAAEARSSVAQELARIQQDKDQSQRMLDEWRAKNEQDLQRRREEAQKSLEEAAIRRAEEQNKAQFEEQLRNRMVNKLKQDPELTKTVDEYVAANNYEGLKSIYRDKLETQIEEGQKDSAYYNRVATAYGVAEKVASVTVTASKAALITIGGPAGMAVTATAVGAVSAAQDGAESYVRGDKIGEVVARTAVGFVSGAKDGAIGVYTNMPGVSTAAKVLVPAAADAADTYVRISIDNPDNLSQSERLKKALGAGGVSLVSNFIGAKVDGIKSTVTREVAGAGVAVVTAGTSSVVQGGSFGDGVQQGLEGYVGGKIGGLGGNYLGNRARSNTEQTVQVAITEAQQGKKAEIDITKQAKIIQDMDQQVQQTKKERAAGGGEETGKIYVDENKALDQLRDTRSSRTAKQAPKEVQDAIIDTRADKIYGPADAKTIAKAEDTLSKAGLLKPGDKLTMDTFSTPGKPPSLGADRDARLVIERTNPETGKVEKIEVPRKHWENDAYKDFYEHTTNIAGGKDAITPETHPDYFKSLKEMQHMQQAEQKQYEQRLDKWQQDQINNPNSKTPPPTPPLTPEQIEHRAWAEVHNQLFTDKFHVEASADNSDQITRFAGGHVVEGQKTSSVVDVQKGKSELLDPAGYAKMWEEKSRIYTHMGNQPEAIAQSQKGIEQYMKVRDGYHAQGYEVPPLDARTAKAMEIITKAPVGVDATPEAIAKVETQLKELGYQGTSDAMGKIATQNEVLKFSRPRAQLGAGMISQLAKDGPRPRGSSPLPEINRE